MCVGLFFVGIELSSPFSPMLRRDSIDLNPPHSTQETEKQICALHVISLMVLETPMAP